MHVFVTGPTGGIGSGVVDQLVATGHEVTGLARSDASAAALAAKGATVHRGELEDLDTLRSGAQASGAVVHLAFKHDFSDLAASNVAERNAVQTLCQTLKGSERAAPCTPPLRPQCPPARSPRPSAAASTYPSPPYPLPPRRSTSDGSPCSSDSTSPPAARQHGHCSTGPPVARP